ncbi:hypothetical protein FA15DRAFT_209534 [Coprinopsis marcescibilis]|uniref:Uncharacterized protein n=1 Tax=Coprinopsis marcescibilis TaxID=230819 RepID=A0A5C3L3Z6_COPMA|nr:hypothetical protein FA15DRAFT_209534 [Coprinopsis marcescibilis]
MFLFVPFLRKRPYSFLSPSAQKWVRWDGIRGIHTIFREHSVHNPLVASGCMNDQIYDSISAERAKVEYRGDTMQYEEQVLISVRREERERSGRRIVVRGMGGKGGGSIDTSTLIAVARVQGSPFAAFQPALKGQWVCLWLCGSTGASEATYLAQTPQIAGTARNTAGRDRDGASSRKEGEQKSYVRRC